MNKAGVLVLLLGAAWLYLNRIAGQNNSALDVLSVNANLLLAGVNGGLGAVNMNLSDAGLQAIASREGFSGNSYPDAGGRSIGYGHYILIGESFNEPISPQQGMDLLRADAALAEKAVQAYVTVPINQNQFDALVSFAYNVGVNAFKSSTLLSLINQGNLAGAAAQFPRWDKSQGQVLPQLIARRASEQQQFLA